MKQITYIILAAMLLLCGGFGYERLRPFNMHLIININHIWCM